jgi:cytoskeletal protein RodZ
LPSFGENLRREREKRKITIEQISQSTKIGTRMLVALEEDKFNQLPGGIFNKGFVRAYARCLGLDEDQAVADYLQASGETAPTLPDIPEEKAAPRIVEASYEPSQRQLPWGTFAAVLLLAALALSIWSNRQKRNETAAPAAQPAAAPSVTQKTSAPSGPQQTRPVRAPATEAVKSSSEASPPSGAGIFAVNVQAREDSWTVITSDGRTVYSGVLAAEDERTIRGRQQIVVKTGNSGAVDLFFNGKKVTSPGQYGEVRTLTFGPDGMVPNAPAPVPNQQP